MRENIQLRRGFILRSPGVVGAYLHQPAGPSVGRIAAAVALEGPQGAIPQVCVVGAWGRGGALVAGGCLQCNSCYRLACAHAQKSALVGSRIPALHPTLLPQTHSLLCRRRPHLRETWWRMCA